MKKTAAPADAPAADPASAGADPASTDTDVAAAAPAPDKHARTKKPRIVYVAKILARESDAQHPLSLARIQQLLTEHGISSERKALYRDLAALDEAGFKIGRSRTRPVGYYLAERLLEPSQMTLLVDAVQTSRSITKANSESIIRSLKGMISRHEAASLEARVHVADRVKMQNESVFRTLDAVQRALAERRDVTFEYMRYDAALRLHDVAARDGKKRVKTPLFLVYSDENYYMLAFDESAADNLRSYRVDRMRNVMLLEESPRDHRPAPGFDIAEYEHQVLGMYGGTPEPIVLLVVEELVGSMVDLFGAENVSSTPAGASTPDGSGRAQVPDDRGSNSRVQVPDDGRTWARMSVKAAPSPVLFGKLAQFAGDVRIASPAKVRASYQAHLQKCLQ